MKITVKEKPESKSEFPKLMINKEYNIIILAVDVDHKNGCFIGSLLKEGSSTWNFSEINTRWNFKCFEDFHGEITLSND